MNRKIHIQICTGTTCFVMGAGHLMQLEDLLPAAWREHVEITGVHCLNLCTDPTAAGKPPFVKVNGQLYPEATVDDILAVCRGIIEGEENI